jgi:hypothetical protein
MATVYIMAMIINLAMVAHFKGTAHAFRCYGFTSGVEPSWCPRRDSNPEPTDYESAALTVELQGHNFWIAVAEFETEMSVSRTCLLTANRPKIQDRES